MKGFINVKTYIKGRGIVCTNIAINNGRIAEIGGSADTIQPLAQTGECLLVPGFIDEHIHGAGGADVMDASENALAVISDTVLKEGTTSFLATTMTQSDSNLKKALGAVAAYKRKAGAKIMGVHLEGPFISSEYIGAQQPKFIKKPSVGYFKELQVVAENKIKLVTLAPEEDGEGELVSYLKEHGIIASVGHSNATEEQVKNAIKNGLSCVTHTFNAQSPFRHREAGIAGSALLYDELFCEVIADAIHVSVSALKLLIKNKPKDRVILITDAMRAKGFGDGASELGGQTVTVENGQARLADGTLAGSVLKMNEAVKNTVLKCNAAIEDAIDFATYNPAKNLGLENEYGAIKEGARADFTLLNSDFNVMLTVVDGEIAYIN